MCVHITVTMIIAITLMMILAIFSPFSSALNNNSGHMMVGYYLKHCYCYYYVLLLLSFSLALNNNNGHTERPDPQKSQVLIKYQ